MPSLKHIAAALLLVLIASPILAGVAAVPAEAQRGSRSDTRIISAADAYHKSLRKELILLDIRTPDEWAQSGIPATAHALTMHQSGAGFFGALDKLTLLDKSKPIALICAVGARSAYLQKILGKSGYRNIFNVSEGMFGNKRDGAGWLKAGLPVKRIAPRRAEKKPQKPAKDKPQKPASR